MCWQHPPEAGATGDTEHILIVREAERVNNQLTMDEENNRINQENINLNYNNNTIR